MTSTILIADDSPTLRMLVRRALEPGRHRIVEAEDGGVALSLLARDPADLVITDVNMPEMDGLTLIRRLRAMPDYRFTPILVLTTESGDDVKARGREAGATGWLVKPFESARLRTVVDQVLRRRA